MLLGKVLIIIAVGIWIVNIIISMYNGRDKEDYP